MEGVVPKIWAVGGGKGGVGKSFLAVNLSCGLAQRGHRVVLVDADLAGANVHTMLGLRQPDVTLGDYLLRDVLTIDDILLPTRLEGLRVICGAADILEMANPRFEQKQRLMKAISGLAAEFIIIDVGAGATLNNLDFFNMADGAILVTSPAPTAMQNVYSFLKMAVMRRLGRLLVPDERCASLLSDLGRGEGPQTVPALVDAVKAVDEKRAWTLVQEILRCRFRLVVSMAGDREAEQAAAALAAVAYQYLRLKLPHIGGIAFSMDVERSIRRMHPLMLAEASASSEAIWRIVRRVISEGADEAARKPASRRDAVSEDSGFADAGRADVQLCLNDEVEHGGMKLHVQTEDLGRDKARILTLVFSGGRILFTKDSGYAELEAKVGGRRPTADLVRWQHRGVMAGIRAGKLAARLSAERTG